MSGGFCQAVGEWKGTAEVYDGRGVFQGNGVDQRNVTEGDDGRVRIELSFTGPFSFSGHYVIEDRGDHRLYQGPVNVGFAEALGESGVQADNYWQAVGMTQRFLLMVAPSGTQQLSLALMSRGERLCYAVVGENHKQTACSTDGSSPVAPSFLSRASIDVADDPSGGRGEILLHRPGRWHGTLRVTDGELGNVAETPYEQTVVSDGTQLTVRTVGGRFAPEPCVAEMTTDGWHAWSHGGPVAGSYSLSGGRASSGHLHLLSEELRVWRREVVTHDGTMKAIVENWYRGGVRVGSQHGWLSFEPS